MDKKIILYLGRLIPIKGIDFLIRAFSKLEREFSDVFLLIAGTGPSQNYLKRLASSLKIENLFFTCAFVDSFHKNLYYQIAYAVVLPSIYHRTAEAWGLVLNEALSYSKPIVATNMVGAAYDLVKDGENGFMVAEQDADMLYEALKVLVSNPELARRVSCNGKRVIQEKFTIGHMIKSLEDAFNYATKC